MTQIKKVVILFLFFVIPFHASAQQGKYADSILAQLKLVIDAKNSDSVNYNKVADLIAQNRSEVLLEDTAILNELERLQTVLGEEEYVDLYLYFFQRHFFLDSVPNEALIRFGKNFIEKNKANCKGACKEILLQILRESRIPFRNSGHLYEGIEYYIQLSSFFAEKNDRDAAAIAYSVLPGFYSRIGLYEKAEYYLLKSISYLDDNPANDTINVLLGASGKANRYMILGRNLLEKNRPDSAEKYLQLSIRYFSTLNDPSLFNDAPYLFLHMAKCKTMLESDSSTYYYNKVFGMLKTYEMKPVMYAWYYLEKGKYFLSKEQMDSASFYISKAKDIKDNQLKSVTSSLGELIPNYYAAILVLQQGKPQQAIQLLLPEIQELRVITAKVWIIKELQLLAKAYAAAGMFKEGFNAQQELLRMKEELENDADVAKLLSFDIERRMQENEKNIALLKTQDESNKKVKYYLVGITALLGLFAITLGVAIFNKQKSNAWLTTKNEEISNALDKLKQTQSQLVQSEKMASLGELTAGIAHEIQNPLNFVNNFSEVNEELLVEMKDELNKGNLDGAKSIAKDVIENQQKVLHHGKRADAIVKSMLQHSRSNNGIKEPTDINALTNEYLRLAYHGLRAKDNSFNATMKSEFDESIGNIHIIPQDIGRVILNIITNAFYAVNEKSQTEKEGYEPTVFVSTKKSGDKVLISVKDNGNGIPQKVLDKIFQPFFTTKPTGQGTGLGLSLSYDIVKAHGGKITVETKAGSQYDLAEQGSEFIIQLPLA